MKKWKKQTTIFIFLCYSLILSRPFIFLPFILFSFPSLLPFPFLSFLLTIPFPFPSLLFPFLSRQIPTWDPNTIPNNSYESSVISHRQSLQGHHTTTSSHHSDPLPSLVAPKHLVSPTWRRDEPTRFLDNFLWFSRSWRCEWFFCLFL